MRIYTNNGVVVGRLVIEPGETVKAVFNLTDPLNINSKAMMIRKDMPGSSPIMQIDKIRRQECNQCCNR